MAAFKYNFDAAYTAATDEIEMGFLPAGAQITRLTVIGNGVGAVTAKVGWMSGTFGDVDTARTVGSEFFATQSVNDTEASVDADVLHAIAPDANTHRPIGLTLSADVAAGSAKYVQVIIEYHF